MDGQQGEIEYEGTSEVPGAEVLLGDGSRERLDKDQLEQPLFHDDAGQAASAGQMLTAFFQQTGTTPRDYVQQEMLQEANERGLATRSARLEVRNGGSLLFQRGDERVAFETIVFELQLTVRPQQNA